MMEKERVREGLMDAYKGLSKVFSALELDSQRVQVIDRVNSIRQLESTLLRRPYKPISSVVPGERWGSERRYSTEPMKE